MSFRFTQRPLRALILPVAGPTLVAAAAAVALQNSPQGHVRWNEPAPEGFETVFYDGPGLRGELTGGATLQPAMENLSELPVTPAPVTTLFRGEAAGLAQVAPSGQRLLGADNRVDLVFVGDGYTASELGTYQNHVNNVVGGLFSTEPLTSYIDYFAVHRIDVISNESGVDNDPSQGILRDTALDMQFWCSGIERLLCVSVGAAYSYANNAPSVDQVIALANTTKYGGAGYLSSNLATSSGGNSAAVEIVKHELGHSLGRLADEYTYGGPTNWTGGEPSGQNVSTYEAATMASNGQKWANWLGASASGFDGTIGTFEGAQYSVTGIYRPSNNSLMRALGRNFNLVGAEQVLKEIYRKVEPIDSASDPALDYTDADTLVVSPMNVVGAPLSIQWSLDGTPIPGATGMSLDLGTLGLGGCMAEVSVRVVDETPWVRDETFRAARMTQELTYRINEVWTSLECVASPNSVGAGADLSILGSPSLADEDLGLSIGSGPVGAPVLFFYGSAPSSVALGEGTLCAGGTIQRVTVRFFDNLGQAFHTVDFQNDPVSSGATALLPGTTWIFQGWYRDTATGGAATFNFSSAQNVSFCP
ncbi:IgA Peptidase M64 [Planctomycetes bacterium Poly30]|uniref:IgA Peptidase M64 n=1 Tax=Saltatorellus ferox TaxID=2528018 RepID=A0A518ELB5_9BACT|nr:IgA Peptidase M64 [Planctomycetes bacterium Poly30]